jgi:hypothetical protein
MSCYDRYTPAKKIGFNMEENMFMNSGQYGKIGKYSSTISSEVANDGFGQNLKSRTSSNIVLMPTVSLNRNTKGN